MIIKESDWKLWAKKNRNKRGRNSLNIGKMWKYKKALKCNMGQLMALGMDNWEVAVVDRNGDCIMKKRRRGWQKRKTIQEDL